MRARAILILFLAAAVSACSTPTLPKRCGIPTGLECLSTDAVYERVVDGTLPTLIENAGGGSIAPPPLPSADIVSVSAADSGEIGPVYIPARPLRVWVNQWTDRDGDLHDASYLYIVVGEGRWVAPPAPMPATHTRVISKDKR